MIDTIKIAQVISQEHFKELCISEKWNKSYAVKTGAFSNLWLKEKGKQNPYLSTFTAPDGISYLSASVSLPSFYYGSNAKLLTQEQVWEALKMLSFYVSHKSWLDFDAMTANVWEIHFTQDVQLNQSSIKSILEQISQMNIPHFQQGLYRNSTVYFDRSKAKTICFYNKYQACKDGHFSKEDLNHSKGKLRIEYRYRTNNSVKRLSKKENLPNREAQTIFQKELSDKILNPLKEQIKDLLKYTDAQQKIKLLTSKYGCRRASTLISHLIRRDICGDKYFEDASLSISKSVYYKNQKDCRDAGVYSLLKTLG